MKVDIRDTHALRAVSPAALSAYARVAGWAKVDTYGDHSDIYAAGGLPEIILPRTRSLGDYAHVVSQLVETFAKVAGMDEMSLYRDLVTADRDVIRVRVEGQNDGAVRVRDGINLVSGARDMLLAAAYSLNDPQPVYRAGANKEASQYIRRVRLGQTEQGSFAIILQTPVIPPQVQRYLPDPSIEPNPPIDRQMTMRLDGALAASLKATERTTAGEADAFARAVAQGASANLCESLVKLIEPFPIVDVSLVWARTRPMSTARSVFRFISDDAPILREAARSFRNTEAQPNAQLFGFVQRLKRDEHETDGTVTLRAFIDGKVQSVIAVLNQIDYERAIQAHKEKSAVMTEGDLKQAGQRWHLLNPRIAEVIPNEGSLDEGEQLTFSTGVDELKRLG